MHLPTAFKARKVMNGRRLALMNQYGRDEGRIRTYDLMTDICSADGRTKHSKLPGWLFAEYPEQNAYVLRNAITAGKPLSSFSVSRPCWVAYCDRNKHALLRTIVLLKPAEFTEESGQYRMNIVFVPNHEIVYVHLRSDVDSLFVRPGNSLPGIVAFRCGPVGADLAPNQLRQQAPPTSIRSKSKVTYKPFFRAPPLARNVHFFIKEPKAGMEVDPATGEFTWTPTKDQAGKHKVTIMVDVDAWIFPALEWKVEVK